MKYLKVFFVIFFSLSVNAQTLKLPEVSAEYVCNTKFIIGANSLETRTFRSKNKKRIDTVIQNVPQSVIIDYGKQIVTWVWPKTFSYLSEKVGIHSFSNRYLSFFHMIEYQGVAQRFSADCYDIQWIA